MVFYLWRDQGAMRSLYGAGEAYPAADVMQGARCRQDRLSAAPSRAGRFWCSYPGRARMLLSAKGVQVAVPAGYDLFDKDEPLGTSQFVHLLHLIYTFLSRYRY